MRSPPPLISRPLSRPPPHHQILSSSQPPAPLPAKPPARHRRASLLWAACTRRLPLFRITALVASTLPPRQSEFSPPPRLLPAAIGARALMRCPSSRHPPPHTLLLLSSTQCPRAPCTLPPPLLPPSLSPLTCPGAPRRKTNADKTSST